MQVDQNKMALGVVLASVLIGLTPFIIEATSVEQTQYKEYSNISLANPENKSGNLTLGVNPAEGLRFGEKPVYGVTGGHKDLVLNAEKKSLIVLEAEGNVSKVLEFEEKHYFKGEKSIPIKFNTDGLGYYEGNVTVNINVPKNEVGKKWLDLRSRFYF